MIKITLRSNLLSDKRLESININSLTNQAVSTLSAEIILCKFWTMPSNGIKWLNIVKYSLLIRHLLNLIIYIRQKAFILPTLCFKKIVSCYFVASNLLNVFEDLKDRVLFVLYANQSKFSNSHSGIGIIKYNVKINWEII